MSTYHAPLQDMLFVMKELAGLDQIGKLPGYEDATPDTVTAILEEAAKFATEVLDPLNAVGDREGSTLVDGGIVRTPTGFKDAYQQFVANGWNGLTKRPEHGGQGLPQLVSTAVEEMWHGANLAFALCPLLTQGAIEALELVGTDEQKAIYLPKMVEGTWTGTMNLTEPQAGSDLAAVRTRAVPQPDGSYKLYGQKIFITYGDQDYTENIVHLVLARTPTAPEGVKGISLFVVPKFLVNADGSVGARNDVQCVSLEHKLGIHASPTAVLAYGDHGGAVGQLVGVENRGLEYMFIMMNLARYSVGVEGIGISERAYQRALDYARDRVQGRAPGLDKATPTATILQHPDVRRMLVTMKALTESMRAVAYVTGAAIDNATHHPDADARKRHQAFVDFMIPIVKGCSTEVAQQVTYLARAGAWRDGFHRGNGRRATLSRCAHHHDLRGHHGHPGERSHRPQDRTRRGRHCACDRRRGEQGRDRPFGPFRRRPQGDRCRPVLSGDGAARSDRLDGRKFRLVAARGVRSRCAVSADVGAARGRLADGARGADRAQAAERGLR